MNINIVKNFFDEYLRKFPDKQQYWNYEDGCLLLACKRLYEVTGEKHYYDFIINYLDKRVTADGDIPSFQKGRHNIDSINCGKMLYYAYLNEKDEKYKKAIELHMEYLRNHPRCKCGSFWHKDIYPNQIWLDGLYMGQPFYLEYELRFNNEKNLDDIMNQFNNVRKYLYNSEKKLYYHGFDEARLQPWADKVTGCSENFWSRACGWWVMALADTAELLKTDITSEKETALQKKEFAVRLSTLLQEAIDGLLQYRDKNTGLFYQLIDKAEVDGNYTETSGSEMIACAIMKGCRLGMLEREKYLEAGRSIFESICENKLVDTGNGKHLTGICLVAGLGPGEARNGSVEYYLSEPVGEDETKGVAALGMCLAEYMQIGR